MLETFREAEAFLHAQAIRMVDLKFSDLWGRWRRTARAHDDITSAVG